MTIEERIKVAKAKTREMQNEQIKFRAQLQQLNKQKDELIAECKAKGFDPNTLQKDREHYENELAKIVKSLEELLSNSQSIPF